MQTIWAEQALIGDDWQKNVTIEIGDDARIAKILNSTIPRGTRTGVLLPAPANVHSHAFQRAMAGMSERRGPADHDTFWTWRKLMFRFLEQLTPDDIEAIASFVQMEMLEAGYAASGEFHYVHHQPDGTPYDNLGELSARIAAAAEQSGIGLTLLPVLYQQGGCDGGTLAPGQVRFGNNIDRFSRLFTATQNIIKYLPADTNLGVAPHSLRAVSRDGLAASVALAPNKPLHMHLAEQIGEVNEVHAAYGQRPVDWLLNQHNVDDRWCLIHSTQMTNSETQNLANTGAVVGLCPITESSLGDGIFNGATYLSHGGKFGIGSDSNIRISLSEELRTFEYSQRLRDRHRAILATQTRSTGRVLYDGAAHGGAQAIGRNAGKIVIGAYADLMALDTSATDLGGKQGDELLDSYIFAGDDSMVCDVWSAGRHLVKAGSHIRRDAITARYRKTVQSLKERI